MIEQGKNIKPILDMSSSASMYSRHYLDDAAQMAIRMMSQEPFSQLLQFCKSNTMLQYSLRRNNRRLIMSCITEDSIGCFKELLDNGADITNSSNTHGVLLMSTLTMRLTLFEQNTILLCRLIDDTNLKSSYLFLDAMCQQLALFLAAMDGNEEALTSLLESKRGHSLINRRTGNWDNGKEVMQLASTCKYIHREYHRYQFPNKYLSEREQQQMKERAQHERDLQNQNLDKVKLRHSEYKMIEKTLMDMREHWQPEWSSFTLLHWAAKGGHLGAIKLLLDHGAAIDTKTIHNRSAMDIAQVNNHTDCVGYLQQRMESSQSPKHLDQLKQMIQQSNDDPSALQGQQYQLGTSQLNKIDVIELVRVAIRSNHPNVLQHLYTSSALTSDWTDNDGNTPVHIAASLGLVECLTITAQYSNVCAFNNAHETPLMVAIINGHSGLVVQTLVQSGAQVEHHLWFNSRNTYLLKNVLDSKQQQVYLLMLDDLPSLLHTVDPHRRTLLHLVALYGGMDLLLPLIESFSDSWRECVNARDLDGNTPCHLAIKSDNIEVLAYLLGNGANIHMANVTRTTPRQMAIIHGNEVSINLIEQHGDDCDGQKSDQTSSVNSLSLDRVERSGYECRSLIMKMGVKANKFLGTEEGSYIFKNFMRYLKYTKLEEYFNMLLSQHIQVDQAIAIFNEMHVNNITFSNISDVEQIINMHLSFGRYDVLMAIMENMAMFTIFGTKVLMVIGVWLVTCESQLTLERNGQFLQRFSQSLSPDGTRYLDHIINYDRDILLGHYIDHSTQPLVGVQPARCFNLAIQSGAYKCATMLLERFHDDLEHDHVNQLSKETIDQQQTHMRKVAFRNRDQFIQLAAKYLIPSLFIEEMTRTASNTSHFTYIAFYDEGIQNNTKDNVEDRSLGEDLGPNNNNGGQCPDCHKDVVDLDDHAVVCLERECTCPNAQVSAII
ncbi:hypothetical protein SAMD00019534_051410 [Acytostelium subglobosum LB1]|uniref:hypothetical protein n=1 Tax=Acytostelium subglobosum LB1 TaxID=1410327 RepID=UPI000644E3CB|nr:hypothetical protein SAMD00019534_051410 [Acytostelium subglobosum LB1]GAM21966.1 hypothetical protein SAMD00019534_051410 [Acytostelium subglobosum LB1]|eukprot:XP_012755066.1 hypothetical protein SAMD00019534_051410 [Acytostelium subglobosum LB1]